MMKPMDDKDSANSKGISVTKTAEELSYSDNEDYDDDNTGIGGSSSGDSVTANRDEQKLNLAKKETQAVFKLRLLVFMVLLLAAIAVSVIVYLVTATAEKNEYRNQYDAAAKKVLESFEDIAISKLQAVSSLGVAMIAHGVDHVRQWPFVTLSSFQQRTSTCRAQSGALYVTMNPMVTPENKDEWEKYVLIKSENYWINQGLEYQKNVDLVDYSDNANITPMLDEMESWPVWVPDEVGVAVPDNSGENLMPTWQTSPVYNGGANVNENLMTSELSAYGLNASFYSSSVVFGDMITSEPGGMDSDNSITSMLSLMLSTHHNKTTTYEGDPISQVFFPIFDNFEDTRKPVAVMTAWISWISYFKGQLPESLQGVVVVLHNTCSGYFTYEINGEEVRPVGIGDLHEAKYNHMKQSASFETVQSVFDGTKDGLPLNKDECMISVDVYPSSKFYSTYHTGTPIIMTFVVAFVFVFTVCMFLFYDRLVERRQALVMQKAVESNAIVTSLFPENVRDRLMKMNNDVNAKIKENMFGGLRQSHRLKAHLRGATDDGNSDAPIADLFPHCTVLFADIAGFTAWSSTRSPEQVFTLLQTVYQSFDKIAKRRRVFKVETIGDSYLAVCGLPEPQPDHAIIMVRFAWDCLHKMHEVTRELERALGPDTGDLAMRFGLHSGPVTAGVLRGERARFQLFGDTVNTASRMESNGERGRIQVSQDTADLIKAVGREQWLVPRKDKVAAKGKGMLQTYWVLNPAGKKDGSSAGSAEGRMLPGDASEKFNVRTSLNHQPRNVRLIEWMVDLLMDDIKKIVFIRKQSGSKEKESSKPIVYIPPEGKTCMDEVKTSIEMAKFNAKKASTVTEDYTSVKIPEAVVDALRDFVAIIASKYRDNPFHNFEHACHVTMSVKKLLKRIIVAPELSPAEVAKLKKNPNHLASRLHDSTYGITSDPLAMLAISFSALIHDVDHRGVSNAQLAVENKDMSERYSNKSVAEQNSLDLSWDILMEGRFDSLRRCLFASQSELLRFRQIVVNMVLATDIFDKELNGLRKTRWERAFSNDSTFSNDSNLRATIVIEHVIQASDVSHTMQHWHVYQKWNRFLFLEMHKAYCQGRMAKDPSSFWYQGEIGFFDNYVIPLAKKLKECGCFGVSSDEYLNYALQNRAEWEERGQSIVQSLVQEAVAGMEEQEV